MQHAWQGAILARAWCCEPRQAVNAHYAVIPRHTLRTLQATKCMYEAAKTWNVSLRCPALLLLLLPPVHALLLLHSILPWSNLMQRGVCNVGIRFMQHLAEPGCPRSTCARIAHGGACETQAAAQAHTPLNCWEGQAGTEHRLTSTSRGSNHCSMGMRADSTGSSNMHACSMRNDGAGAAGCG